MTKNKLQAVVFDVDGTIIDTRELVNKAIVDVLARRGVQVTDAQIAAVAGKPVQGMYTLLAPEHNAAELEIEHLAHHADNLHLIQAYDHVHEVLSSLQERGYKLGIFTGFNKTTHERLAMFDLGKYFDAVVDCTMYTAHKPDPEGLFLCLQMLGVDKGSAVYIGDGVSDALAGKAANVTTFGITHGYADKKSLEQAGADYVVDNLLQFKRVLSESFEP